MIWLAGTIISSVLFGHIMKWSSVRRANLLWVGFFNYLIASLSCWLVVGLRPPHHAVGFTLLVGAGAGVCFLLSLLCYFAAVARLGMSLSTAAIRLSVALPVAAALLFWHESLHPIQAAGLALVGLALLLLGIGAPPARPGPPSGERAGLVPGEPARDGRGRAGLALLLGLILPLFVVTGAGQLAARVYSGGAPSENAVLYTAATFGAACLSTLLALRFRPAPLAAQDLWLGALLGTSNTVTNLLLLQALRDLPSAEVFSISSAASVALAAVTGVIVWRERLSRPAIGAVVCAACAVVLLAR